MKRILSIVILCTLALIAVSYFFWGLKRGFCRFPPIAKVKCIEKTGRTQAINTALELLRARKDNEALAIFNKLLIDEPENLDAYWGKAEVLRRNRDYNEAQSILTDILKKDPRHISSLISASYIAYKDDKLSQASGLISEVFATGCPDAQNQALAYMMLGAINSRRSANSGLFNKIKYGTQIKCHFLKASRLAPDLPEVHLGLGTFYLLAPPIFGRDIEKAIEELELALRIAPDFATANARLAQCYRKKGSQDKYSFYLSRAQKLDPQNEVLRELQE